jgi:hypothetical protein
MPDLTTLDSELAERTRARDGGQRRHGAGAKLFGHENGDRTRTGDTTIFRTQLKTL